MQAGHDMNMNTYPPARWDDEDLICLDCGMPNMSPHDITADECEQIMQSTQGRGCANRDEHHPFRPKLTLN